MSATKYLMFNSVGSVIGVGYTPDGTLPSNTVACTDLEAEQWQGSRVSNSTIVAPAVIATAPVTVIASTVFMLRFTPSELTLLATAAQTVPWVLLWLIKCYSTQTIDVSSDEVINTIDALSHAGYITSDRVSLILAPVV